MSAVLKSAKPARRRAKHDPRVSEAEILEAAEQLLRERPFREVNVDEIMRRTGLKRPAFYVHFRDRYDLVLRVLETIGHEIQQAAERWTKGHDPLEDARRTVEGDVAVYLRHGTVLRAIADAAGTDERVERAYRAFIQRFIDVSADHIRAEQAAGRIRAFDDVDEISRALTWLTERYLSESLGRTPQADPEVVTRVLFDIWASTLYGSPPVTKSRNKRAK